MFWNNLMKMVAKIIISILFVLKYFRIDLNSVPHNNKKRQFKTAYTEGMSSSHFVYFHWFPLLKPQANG